MAGRMTNRFEVSTRLLEIADAGFEDRLVLVSRNVFCDLCSGALGVCHFPEDPAAWRGDAFDGKGRSVRVECVVE